MDKEYIREELPPQVEKTLKVIRGGPHASLYKIVYHEGGVVPKELRGSYNKRRVAEVSIVEYNKTKKPSRRSKPSSKDTNNAKSKDKTRV